MGRQKGDPNRNKNRPSSSSAAASLVQSSKALSVGFGGYVGSSRVDASDIQEKDYQWDVDGEATLHLRRLSKKDSTTRVKALKALIVIFKERPANELCQLLPNWIFEYKKLVQDESQQVREGTHNAMSAIAVSVGRGLAPHLRMVMGAWWVSQFDPVREVSTAAQQSFQVAFQGPPKRLEALMFCASDVLTHIDGLFKLSPQTISEKSIPIEESTKKYDLVISSALLALAALLDVILQNRSSTSSLGNEPMEIDKGDSNEKKLLERRREVEDLAAKLCISHKHFRDFVKSKSSQIRCASYQALRAFAQNVSAVFSAKDMDNVGGIVLGAFSEKDPACHAAMWDMVLYISQRYPQAWNTNSTRKFVLPRFWSFLRHATYGSAKVSYPCILPLLSLLPLDTIKPAIEFFQELFVSLWDGHNGRHMALEDEIVFLKTIQECFLWIINNAERFAANENISVESIQNFMIENVLLELMWNGYAFAGFNFPFDSLPHIVSVSKGDGDSKETSEITRKFERERYSSQFLENLRMCITDVLSILAAKSKNVLCVFWRRFQDICVEAVIKEAEQSVECLSTVRIGCVHRISEFLSHLGKQLLSDEFQKPWLLNQAVRPLVAKLFPMVKATDFSDAIRLLARIVSIYGPFSFPVLELSQKKEEREAEMSENGQSSIEGDDKEIIFVSSFLRNELIPWCLAPSMSSCTEKIELLLSFFEDGRFLKEWSSVLSYATKLEDAEIGPDQISLGKVIVLAVLIENFRLKFFDLDKGENCKNGENQSPKQWDLSGLDRAAVAIAGSVLLSEPSSLRLLRHILGGSKIFYSPSLVSSETVEKIFRLLLQRMLYVLLKSEKDWAKFAASSALLPDIELPLATVEDEKAIALGCAAAQAICGSVFSLELVNNLEVASKAVASFYCIHWVYGILLKKEQRTQFDSGSDNNESSDEDEHLFHHDVSLMSNNCLVEDIQETVTNVSLLLSSGFCRSLMAPTRAHIQQILIQCVRHAVFEGVCDVLKTTSACGKWVLALMDQLCTNAEDVQQVLDMLLEPTDAWPLFTTTRPAKLENFPILVEDRLGLSFQEPRHVRFVALVDKVASFVGWEKLVVPSLESNQTTSKGKSVELEEHCRIWLLIEMLCTWHWPGGSAVNSVVPFMVSCTDGEEGNLKETVVNSVVVSLFASAMSRNKVLEFNNKFWIGSNDDMEDVEDPCLRALLVFLSKILREGGRAQNAEMFFKMLVIEQGYLEDSLSYERSKVLPFILSILVPFLRKQQENVPPPSSNIVNHIPLEVAVCKWLDLASSAPPLNSYIDFIPDLEHTLQVIVACFPLHSAGGSVAIMAAASAQITSHEMELLLNLMQKEASHMVGFVAHVAKQYVSLHDCSLDKKDARQVHEEILAKLVTASVAYCWKDFKAQDWGLVMNHMRKWLEAALLEAENFTQLVIDTVSVVEKKTSKELSSAIVDKINDEVQRVSSRKSDLSWTAVGLFSLVQALETSSFPGSCASLKHLESIKWGENKHRALSYILRIVFASGMAESLALDSSAGEAAGNIIASSRISDLDFWENVSDIILTISNEQRVEISRHLNIWTVGKDAVRALYALLFSSQPIGGLQLAAYSLLTSAPFQTTAVTYGDVLLQKDGLEEEAINVGLAESPSLNVANLRRELAVVLETTPASIFESTLVSPVRVKYFLAWAIFLSHLRSVSVSSPGGEKLVQYIQDTVISSTILESIFQHIPLKSETGSSSRRRTSTGLWQAEIDRVGDAARRACTLGSVSFAIEGLWPLEEETVSSLAAGIYGLLLQVLPACVRVWFTGLRDRSTASSVESFTTKFCSPQLLAEEFTQVHNSTIADESLTIKANQSIGEVIVVYKKEEAGMDMVIRMPKCYPLRAVDIDCTRRLGISETRLRKWMLSMASFLRNQNGAVAEAIQIWKQNVDREFEGVEECPICYSIIHTANHSLPRLACRTCKHKFHAACLYKWFSTSHKSTCPLCQTPF
eukprot:c25138_g1_i1 orf=481-6414(-)